MQSPNQNKQAFDCAQGLIELFQRSKFVSLMNLKVYSDTRLDFGIENANKLDSVYLNNCQIEHKEIPEESKLSVRFLRIDDIA